MSANNTSDTSTQADTRLEVGQIKDPVLFMVSSGRSGTTLLRSILNASEEIFIPHESDFLGRVYRFYQDKKTFDQKDYEDIAKLFIVTSRENGWGMSEEYLSSALKHYQPQSFTDVNRVINQAYHQQMNTENLQWGIKSPVMISRLKEILAVFPKIKIIHVVRDGRDVYLSYRKVHENSRVKFGPKRIVPAAIYWIDGLRQVARLQGQVYELRYEEILTDPEDTLSKLCDFIGIPYSSKMYQEHHTLERNQQLVSPTFMKSFHSKAKQGLDPNNIGKFKHKMNQRERFLFEAIAAPFLAKYGYSIEFKFLQSPIWNIFRFPIYLLAEGMNGWRYRKRDFQTLKWAGISRR